MEGVGVVGQCVDLIRPQTGPVLLTGPGKLDTPALQITPLLSVHEINVLAKLKQHSLPRRDHKTFYQGCYLLLLHPCWNAAIPLLDGGNNIVA